MTRRLPPHPSKLHPIAEFLSFIGALVVLGVAFFLGLFFVAVAAGLMLLAAAAVAARVWWLRRQIRRADAGQTRADAEGRVIEGEYKVVDPQRPANVTAGKRDDR
ncbi:MAG TPA: hypothetical protein VM616_00040 [Gammaproteobacteria bacterium]|nr:hypothetical protein [Gammaproteobacteria bacterium]